MEEIYKGIQYELLFMYSTDCGYKFMNGSAPSGRGNQYGGGEVENVQFRFWPLGSMGGAGRNS
jgi:hypothetical protein